MVSLSAEVLRLGSRKYHLYHKSKFDIVLLRISEQVNIASMFDYLIVDGRLSV